MKKFSKKSVAGFAGVMVVCALVLPSMASAFLWSPVGGSDHPLTSSNLSFITEGATAIGWSCASASLTGVVPTGGAVLNITATSFTNCMGHGVAANCTLTFVDSISPWRVTPTTPLQIHDIHETIHFENTAGNPTACAIPITMTLTGTLIGGHFNNVEHGFSLAGASGLVGHAALLGAARVTVSGTIVDSDSAVGHQLSLS